MQPPTRFPRPRLEVIAIDEILHIDPNDGAPGTGSKPSVPAAPPRRSFALTIIDHPDLSRIGERWEQFNMEDGTQIEVARQVPFFGRGADDPGRPLEVPFISRKPFTLTISERGIGLNLNGTQTRVRVDGFSISETCGLTFTSLARGVVLDLSQHVVLLLHEIEGSPEQRNDQLGDLGNSRLLNPIKHEIRRLAEVWSTVLICGEFGTEKVRVAEMIHTLSHREGPLIMVNIPELGSAHWYTDLFGQVNGGMREEGSFGRADGGTLYIEEIDQAPVELQEIIMEYLRTGVLPGPEGPRALDLRLIAGTAAAPELVATQHVPSLLHSLGNVLALPPLRDRREDIAALFLARVRRALHRARRAEVLTFRDWYHGGWLPKGFLARLTLYRWPGNLAQLENVAEQLVSDSLGRPQAKVTRTLERMF